MTCARILYYRPKPRYAQRSSDRGVPKCHFVHLFSTDSTEWPIRWRAPRLRRFSRGFRGLHPISRQHLRNRSNLSNLSTCSRDRWRSTPSHSPFRLPSTTCIPAVPRTCRTCTHSKSMCSRRTGRGCISSTPARRRRTRSRRRTPLSVLSRALRMVEVGVGVVVGGKLELALELELEV